MFLFCSIMVKMKENQFETIRRFDENDSEFWSSRDLAKALEYTDYRNFLTAINKAKTACENSGEVIHNHFVDATEMVKTGSGAERSVETVYLSRYACYLIVQNSDPTKVVVAKGQTYFAIQTRRQEKTENLVEDNKRVFLREEMKKHNTNLTKTAKSAGVQNYAIFQNAGYKGLYGGLTSQDIHRRKSLKKSQQILDHMNSEELAANLFRATQVVEAVAGKLIYQDDVARLQPPSSLRHDHGGCAGIHGRTCRPRRARAPGRCQSSRGRGDTDSSSEPGRAMQPYPSVSHNHAYWIPPSSCA